MGDERICPMRRLAPVLLALLLAWGVGAPAIAHEERPAGFPDGTGHRPSFLGWDNPRQRVVCKPSSERRIEAMPDGAVKRRNERLLRACDFRSIQSAINSISKRVP